MGGILEPLKEQLITSNPHSFLSAPRSQQQPGHPGTQAHRKGKHTFNPFIIILQFSLNELQKPCIFLQLGTS